MNFLLVGLSVLFLMLFLAGCAHEQAYKRGARLSRQGQYDKAIEELEKAVALAEESGKYDAAQQYRQKLEEVKLEAGRFYYSKAEEQFAQADLGAARDFIERCIRYYPQDQTYREFRQRLNKAISDAGQLRAEALSLAEQKRWGAAVERIEEALQLYRTLPGGQADLRQIKERAYRYYLGRAQDRLRRNDLEGAEAEAQSALAYRDTGSEAKEVIQTVKDRHEAIRLVANGRRLLEQGDCEEALRLLERADRLYSSHVELPGLLIRAKRAVCDRWLDQGRRAMDTGEYAGALRLFQKSRDLLNGYGGVSALLADARSHLAEVHLRASRNYLRDGMPGCGVLHAVAAMGYQPDSSEAGRQLRQCESQTRQEVRYTIALAGFRAPPRHRAVAGILESAALVHLTRMRPSNVAVVERVDLHSVLDELDLNTTNRFDSRFRTHAGRLHGVDALIMGQLFDSRVAVEGGFTGHGESVYQDGFRPEPNPDYLRAADEADAALNRLKRARARLAEAQARLARYEHAHPDDAEAMARKRRARADVAEARQRLTNAATNLGIAQVRLAATPRDVMVPNMVTHQYPIETITKTAKVSCMLKMVDTATGEVILAERVEGRHAQSDRVVQADPGRNVPGDPLELPDGQTMLDEAADSAIDRLRQSLTMACRRHGHRFVVQMRRAETAGDTVRAADNSIKYLFAHPVRHDHTDRMVNFLRKYLGEEDGLVDIAELLRAHCHLLLEPAELPARLEERDGRVIIQRFYKQPSEDVRCPCTLSSIDGRSVHSIAEAEALLDHYGADQEVSITVLSRGRHVTTDLQLRQRGR
ncbi:MAG: tetratricopeptide repeat protein [Planctomycetota bacterium]